MKKITLFLLFLNLVFGQDKILNNWFKEYNTSGTFVFLMEKLGRVTTFQGLWRLSLPLPLLKFLML